MTMKQQMQAIADRHRHIPQAHISDAAAQVDIEALFAELNESSTPPVQIAPIDGVQAIDTSPDLIEADVPVTKEVPVAELMKDFPAVSTTATAPVLMPIKRVYFGKDKVGRMHHRVGERLGEFLVLDVKDADLTGEALKEKQVEVETIIKGMGDKVATRAAKLIEFASGSSASLNPVILVAIKLLAAEGKLESGEKGNYHIKLLQVPYAAGTARAAGGNTLNMLKQLRLVKPQGSQTFVPNFDSLLLAMVAANLGVVFEQGKAPPKADAIAPKVKALKGSAAPKVKAPKAAPVPVVNEAAALVASILGSKELEAA